MNNFIQNIRFKNSEIHKERIYRFVDDLEVKEDSEYQCIIKPYRKKRTLEQLNYYHAAVVPVAQDFQGLVHEHAHQWLKKHCCEKVYFTTTDDEQYQFTPSIAGMNMKPMAKYIDDCINFLGEQGQAVPPPHYRSE